MHKLCKTNHHYAIMNKLLTNEKDVDNLIFLCYNKDRKKDREWHRTGAQTLGQQFYV
jgi:hypothetical protein